MSNRTAVVNGSDPVEQQAAADANAVQDACNLVAVVGCFHRHLLALHRRGDYGDELCNHPVALSFVSKLNSLCRMTIDREMAALGAIDRIEQGEAVEYEVIPLWDTRLMDSNHPYPVAENLVNRNFTPSRKNETWTADITYVCDVVRVWQLRGGIGLGATSSRFLPRTSGLRSPETTSLRGDLLARVSVAGCCRV